MLVMVLLNSSPPSASYMRQWIGSVLVQIMACRIFGANPLSKLMLGFYQLDKLRNKLQWYFSQKSKFFIQENAFENVVCEMAAILSRKRWVKVWRQNAYPAHLYHSSSPVCSLLSHPVSISLFSEPISINSISTRLSRDTAPERLC